MAQAGLDTLVQHMRTLVAAHHYRDLSDGNLLEHDLDQIPWKDPTHAYGSAADVPDLLRSLRTASPDLQGDDSPLWQLFGNIWHQESASPAVRPKLVGDFMSLLYAVLLVAFFAFDIAIVVVFIVCHGNRQERMRFEGSSRPAPNPIRWAW